MSSDCISEATACTLIIDCAKKNTKRKLQLSSKTLCDDCS